MLINSIIRTASKASPISRRTTATRTALLLSSLTLLSRATSSTSAAAINTMSTTTTMTTATTAVPKNPNFYAIAREHGKTRSDLPLWASKEMDPFQLKKAQAEDDGKSCAAIQRQDVKGVPGAFQILNVFSPEETKRMVDKFEELGFTDDAAVSLPRSFRHNQNLNWIADDETLQIVWDRCKPYFTETKGSGHFMGKQPLGLNGKFRVYKYEAHDFFKLHTDGSWPGSRVVNGKHIQNSFDDRWSMYTFLIYLTDDYEGGATEFLVNKLDPTQPARHYGEAERTGIRTPVGGVLAFPHGEHPLHCLHSGATIKKGIKYIIRTDVLFEL